METNRVQRIRRGVRIVPVASRQPALLLCQPSQGRVLLPWMWTGRRCDSAGGTAPQAEFPGSAEMAAQQGDRRGESGLPQRSQVEPSLHHDHRPATSGAVPCVESSFGTCQKAVTSLMKLLGHHNANMTLLY